jgi:hypothetical protein
MITPKLSKHEILNGQRKSDFLPVSEHEFSANSMFPKNMRIGNILRYTPQIPTITNKIITKQVQYLDEKTKAYNSTQKQKGNVLRRFNQILQYKVRTEDNPIGNVVDFIFDNNA